MNQKKEYQQSFDKIPALKNSFNNVFAQASRPEKGLSVLISFADKYYELFAPLQQKPSNLSIETSDSILFSDKSYLIESSLQSLLRECKSHFQINQDPTLSIPSLSLRITPILPCIEELSVLHLLVLHQQFSAEPLVLVLEDERRAFDARWAALLHECEDRVSPADTGAEDVTKAVAASTAQATVDDDEELDLDIDSPPTHVHDETATHVTENDVDAHAEVLVSTGPKVSTEVVAPSVAASESALELDDELVVGAHDTGKSQGEADAHMHEEAVGDEEIDDIDVAAAIDVNAVAESAERLVGHKRSREEDDAIIDGEPESKRQKLEVETVTTVTDTVTDTVINGASATDLIQVE